MKGYIHSFESFGTVDGPGIRFVVFLQGCPMRCKFCHNPDTWELKQGKLVDTEDVVKEILKYRSYIQSGGVTVSGGEPLVQKEFVAELFTLLKKEGIHTCLDTSGIMYDETKAEEFNDLLQVCDLVLLDIKHIDEQKHIALTGCSSKNCKAFLERLAKENIPVCIRQVLVPGITDDISDLKHEKTYIQSFKNIEKVEVLPYHQMGIVKYEKLNIPYPLQDTPVPSEESIQTAKEILEGTYE